MGCGLWNEGGQPREDGTGVHGLRNPPLFFVLNTRIRQRHGRVYRGINWLEPDVVRGSVGLWDMGGADDTIPR